MGLPDTTPPTATPQRSLEPRNKRRRIVTNIPDELGTLMAADVKRLEHVDIYSLFKTRQGRGDFTNLDRISATTQHTRTSSISVSMALQWSSPPSHGHRNKTMQP
jgi:hypothetical protein